VGGTSLLYFQMRKVLGFGFNLLLILRQTSSFHYFRRNIIHHLTTASIHRSNMLMNELPVTIGITGSIGMGKSTVTKQLRTLGFKVFDADEAADKLCVEFPTAIIDDAVNRKALMKVIMQNTSALKDIELVVHPLVIAKREQFTLEAKQNGEFMIFYDIPLLFENRKNYEIDYVIVVSADPETQRQRVMQRNGMTEENFQSILQKQLPDIEKRILADFIIETNYPGYGESRCQLAMALSTIIQKESIRWQRSLSLQSTLETFPSNLQSSLKQSFSPSSSSLSRKTNIYSNNRNF
jgi:dephospho-CoA kinase